ncbi:hypothetical protein FRX31_031729 [Thalictrum thalictroides]|uniref:Uncharacterized protein n=1 Tax=Thalictrum thalictroides TaxID=46969 RepID=A0A7J6V140_THATH|nr:hypothetical protein FRX31_031729 [Thalictrum thalictroides]
MNVRFIDDKDKHFAIFDNLKQLGEVDEMGEKSDDSDEHFHQLLENPNQSIEVEIDRNVVAINDVEMTSSNHTYDNEQNDEVEGLDSQSVVNHVENISSPKLAAQEAQAIKARLAELEANRKDILQGRDSFKTPNLKSKKDKGKGPERDIAPPNTRARKGALINPPG